MDRTSEIARLEAELLRSLSANRHAIAEYERTQLMLQVQTRTQLHGVRPLDQIAADIVTARADAAMRAAALTALTNVEALSILESVRRDREIWVTTENIAGGRPRRAA